MTTKLAASDLLQPKDSQEPDDRPIGVFDSGIGGLTVLKELESAFPNENFIYLGDTARLPYGSKSSNTIKKYVEQNLKFFLETKNIKALVVACNSASTVLEDLTLPPEIKVFGVIEPGAETALQASKTKNIGLWATRATVNGQAYEKALRSLCAQDLKFTATACPLLVPLVEEGLWDSPLTVSVFDLYLEDILKSQVDTLILGCTHYPLLKASLEKYLKNKNISLQIIDSAIALTQKIKRSFERGELHFARHKNHPSLICLTDDSEHFKSMALKAFPDWKLSQFELVNI